VAKLALASLVLGVPGIVIPLLGPAAFVCATMALRRIHHHPSLTGRKLAITGMLCGLLGSVTAILLALGLYFVVGPIGQDSRRISRIIAQELKYFDYKMQVLADYLATTHPDGKYLVITYGQSSYNADRFDAIQSALKPLNIVKIHELPVPAKTDPDPLTAQAFDQAIADHPGCTIVISTVGLPMDYSQMAYWRRPADQRPKLVLVDAFLYDRKSALQEGTILAAVLYRPDAEYKPNEPMPDDRDAAFHKR